MGSRLELNKIVGDVVNEGEEIFERFNDLGKVFVELGFVQMSRVKWLNLEHTIKNPPELCIITYKKYCKKVR
jgi:hypothetical protein